jgi:hypothetical protein
MRALLDFGSETPDNLDMAERISGERGLRLRSNDFDKRTVGLSLRGLHARLSDILWLGDGSEVPDRLASRLPALSSEDWSAALRAAKLVLLASESANF